MAKPTPETPTGFQFRWNNEGRPPYQFADYMHWRVGLDRCYLTFGQVDLPTQEEPFSDGSVLPIQPLARLVVTPGTLRIWAELLNKAVAELDKTGDSK